MSVHNPPMPLRVALALFNLLLILDNLLVMRGNLPCNSCRWLSNRSWRSCSSCDLATVEYRPVAAG